MFDVRKWRERRREERALKAEQTGDTPEREAERKHVTSEPTVEDAAARASAGLTGSSAPFQG